jgi:hypothetical protein
MAKMTRKTNRKTARKSTRKVNRKAGEWTKFVTQVYREMNRKDKNAKLGDAMKEASRRKRGL